MPHEVMHRVLAHERSLRATRNIAELVHGSDPEKQDLSDSPVAARRSVVGVPIAGGNKMCSDAGFFWWKLASTGYETTGYATSLSSSDPVGVLVSLFILLYQVQVVILKPSSVLSGGRGYRSVRTPAARWEPGMPSTPSP